MNDDARQPLEFFTEEELIDELARRYEVIVFARLAKTTPTNEEINCVWRGGFTTAMGLVTRLDTRLKEIVNETARRKDQ